MASNANTTRATDAPVGDFLENIAHPVRRADATTLLAMMREISGQEPYMYGPSIIGFGTVHYAYDSGREGDMPVIAFAPRRARQVLYLMNGYDGAADDLAALGKHRIGKACLYITRLADVDLAVLRRMIQRAWDETLARYPEAPA